ncbi:hypothetical protein BJF92_13995 [Rhizobium rhizosphaerae]|uniref:Surface antigen n=1 Tax=Xaviernesmea rhizosphaerae TaxID=1672749 RepID=A0A1Q9AIK2_9HYPH|nr:hypothetical protein BJF92_13995 [Xaviernesmea rhizosphaerae]OQP85126.1 hypothetical protein BTR14_17240 [Xaviernesmea rhizosphaerae]
MRPAGFSLFPFLGLCLTLSGCGAGANKSSLVGVNTGAAAASTYLAALGPGIVGEIKGLKLSTADHQRALTAEYRALEGTPSGQEVEWEGKGASGTIVAAAPYQVGSQNCRQLTHTVTIDDREQVARGVACRNGDGTWTPL